MPSVYISGYHNGIEAERTIVLNNAQRPTLHDRIQFLYAIRRHELKNTRAHAPAHIVVAVVGEYIWKKRENGFI